MFFISVQEENWPALNRAAYLIERTCVPNYLPRYCPEAAQLLAAMADCLRRKDPQEKDGG